MFKRDLMNRIVKVVVGTLPIGNHNPRGIEKLVRIYFGQGISMVSVRKDLQCSHARAKEYRDMVSKALAAIKGSADCDVGAILRGRCMAKRKLTELQPIPDWVDQELRNWARWCWSGAYPHPLPPCQCASIEGNYSRFGEDTDAEAIDGKPVPVNPTNAKIVQCAYENLPYLQQQVLRAEYPQRHEQKRVVHVSKEEYAAALAAAIYRVMMVFERGGI